jgi:hypothetical protein
MNLDVVTASGKEEIGHGSRSDHDETCVATRSLDRSRLWHPRVAELLQGRTLAPPDHVPRSGVAMTMLKRPLDLLERAAGAALFVICVEWIARCGSARTGGFPVNR